MKQLIILIMFMTSMTSVFALQTNVTQIDNTTFLINVSNDIILDYMKVEVYDISSNVIDALEAFVTDSIEYYIDYLPYGNYSVFVTASDTMTVPFEFKALIDMPINDTNITLPVNETNTTNTTDPIVTPTPSSGGGSRRKPVIKVVEEEPKPVVKPIQSKLSTKPYWEKLKQDKPVEQPVNVTVEPVAEPIQEEIITPSCSDSGLTNEQRTSLGCKIDKPNYAWRWVIGIILLLIVLSTIGYLIIKPED